MSSEKERSADEPVILARVTGLYGVRGWVKLYSFTDPREGILDYRDCLLVADGQGRETRIEEGRRHGKGVIARLKGVSDRDSAAALVGNELGVLRDALPEPESGSYYWADLEGLTVRHRDGSVLGRVDHLIGTGANDVLVVRADDQERLIPFVVDDVVKNVDLQNGVIDVDWEWD